LVERSKTGVKVSKGENRHIVDRDHVGANMSTPKSTKSVLERRPMNSFDVGATEAGTRIERDTQGSGRVGVVRDSDGGEGSEELGGYIEVRNGHGEVENIGPIMM
jgi:hypothetical protein